MDSQNSSDNSNNNETKSRVFYGEYSLKQWVNLLLNHNIELPPYQRYFVWERDDVIDLINSFNENEFIPPITICKTYENNEISHNYIVDGQQRLTAILMYYLNFFYNSKKKSDKDDENYDEWTINEILKENKSETEILKFINEKIQNKIEQNPYSRLDEENKIKVLESKEEFFEKNFLGFSYVIIDSRNIREQQRFYSKLFNDINTKGKELKPYESRRSYYFMEPKYQKLFDLKLKNIDFIRYLAIISEYENLSNKDINVAEKTYAYRNMEKYLIDYIYDMCAENFSNKSKYKRIEDIGFKNLEDNNYENTTEIKLLKEILENTFYVFKDGVSIIDKDIKMFGLIYFVVFEHKKIIDDQEKIKELKNKLDREISNIKKDENYLKRPNTNKYLNDRLRQSINIYRDYFE